MKMSKNANLALFLPNLQYALSIKLFPWFIYIAINEVELKVLTIKKGKAICVLFSQHAHPETHPATSEVAKNRIVVGQ